VRALSNSIACVLGHAADTRAHALPWPVVCWTACPAVTIAQSHLNASRTCFVVVARAGQTWPREALQGLSVSPHGTTTCADHVQIHHSRCMLLDFRFRRSSHQLLSCSRQCGPRNDTTTTPTDAHHTMSFTRHTHPPPPPPPHTHTHTAPSPGTMSRAGGSQS
jgi:hypothetical protein